MRATYAQIEKALTNNFKIGVDGSRFLYEAIRTECDQAILNAKITKTSFYFTKSDWKKVYREIKKLIYKWDA